MNSMSIESDSNSYINDPESGAEMARLLDQDRTLTKAMGGLLPELGSDIEALQDVLDLACGPGGWAQELAFQYPPINVTGVDISRAMIAYARMQASVRQLENATFTLMDVQGSYDIFPNNSFDLVNGRTMAGFMKKDSWAHVAAQCLRLLRPGGILRLTEVDHWGTSNAPAFSRLMDLTYQAIWFGGHSFDPSRRTFGVTALLERFAREAGLEVIGHRAYAVNFSGGQAAYRPMSENFKMFFKLVEPFLLKMRNEFGETEIPPKEELDHLYEEMLLEMLQEDFAGIFYLLTVLGRKP
jgi:SAM-dependent methyltransferase